MSFTIILVPGYTNSGPQHWQSLWQNDMVCQRVEQLDWDTPTVVEWTQVLNHQVLSAKSPVVFVAHSLGCLTIAYWAQRYPSTVSRVAGAFLVAPPDVERPDTPAAVRDFAPIPSISFPFRSFVVASTTDPYAEISRSYELGASWGSRVINIGDAGHINTSSGLGAWPNGRALFNELLVEIGGIA